ncbi:MAG: sodium:proton exchanger [Candidatus Abyssobacteria bacterium SURF_5]|uniref:Sodium:proton exchanger n=1 Tax=Abyssobacteria bacterium (strain SURF_5) TaxID=2093360 RepID=A0A3A4PDX2_ABYX5|nr:MAG: sodium:proton exchanger [Candidatus Abyssubacteria bacterium SURF_5]
MNPAAAPTFWNPLLDMVVLLAAALFLGLLFERFKQSAILGYLAAGAALGPGGLNLISSREMVSAMAELGVALLLFTIGLEFSLSRLRRLGAIAVGGGSLQIALTAAIVAAGGWAFGLSPAVAIALGLMVAPSSTACVLRVLSERAEIESIHGRNALGILLLQDIAVVPLVLLMTMLGGEGTPLQAVTGLGRSILLVVLFVGVFYLLSNYVLPRLFDITIVSKNRELPILLAAVTVLGSTWAAHALQLSPALGAFIAGFLLAGTPFATQTRADVGALRTLFVTLFFASIGMLADMHFVLRQWPLVAVAVTLIVTGKALIIWPIALLFRNSNRYAVATALSLAQVGEFSFLLAQVAQNRGVLDENFFRLFVTATVATLFLTPYMVASAPRVGEWVDQRIRRKKVRAREPIAPEGGLFNHIIVIGYGPAGRHVVETLRATDFHVLVIEMNPRTVAAMRRDKIDAHVGDASQAEVLEHAQVSTAQAVVVTVPDHRIALQVIRQARALSPKALVFARARYHIFAGDLVSAGAHVVVDEEQEVGNSLSLEVLKQTRQVR